MTLFLFGLTSGATVLTAQYWGKKDIDTIEKVLGLGMRAAVAVGLLFFLAAQLIPGQLRAAFHRGCRCDPRRRSAIFGSVSFSYVFMGITQTYLYIMRSVERVVVANGSLSLFTLMQYYDQCSADLRIVRRAPALGVRGAATGTLVSRLLEMLLVCLYSHFWK